MKKSTITLFGLLLLFVACGSNSTNGAAPVSTTAPSATSVKTSLTAAQIVAAFKTKGLPIGETVDYTAANDPNSLLGRQGQYTSKDSFIDTSIANPSSNTGVNISVSDGGSVEVCANVNDATNRFNYVQTISKSTAIFNEYDYLQGTYILRLSHYLTPDQAAMYQAVFKTLS